MVKQKKTVPVNNTILRWARIESNLSIEEAAFQAKIGAIKARGQNAALSPSKRLMNWESGIDAPTLNQLKNVARVYRRPLLTFFLEKPPVKDTKIIDFRTSKDKKNNDKDTPEFAALIRRIEALQGRLSEILEEANSSKIDIIGNAKVSDDIENVCGMMREKLSLYLENQIKCRNKDMLFSLIRNSAEKAGIFVLKIGNLGSYHTNIDPKEFRGLAISDPYAPLILVNPNDSPAAQLFTIIHELAHIWLGNTGISNINAFRTTRTYYQPQEIFCNKVAAEFLVPERTLVEKWMELDSTAVYENINKLSNNFKVSEIVIARRLLDLTYIDKKVYWAVYKSCIEFWEFLKEKRKKAAKDKDSGIPTEVLIKSKYGKKMVNTIIDAARGGLISELDASHLLNVQLNKFSDIYSTTV